MDAVDLGIVIILGIMGATLAGIILREIAPAVGKILVFCLMVWVIGGIAKLVLEIGIAKCFLGLVIFGAVLYCLWTWSHKRRGR